MIDKINKLIALSSSPFPHEAEMAWSKAVSLSQKYNYPLPTLNTRYTDQYIRKPCEYQFVKKLIHAFNKNVYVYSYKKKGSHENPGMSFEVFIGMPEDTEKALASFYTAVDWFYHLYHLRNTDDKVHKLSYYHGLYAGLLRLLADKYGIVPKSYRLIQYVSELNIKDQNYISKVQNNSDYNLGILDSEKINLELFYA